MKYDPPVATATYEDTQLDCIRFAAWARLTCTQEEADDSSKVAYLTKAVRTDWAALDASPPLDADLVEAIEWTVGKRVENIISQREQTMRAIKKYAVELARVGERERWYAMPLAL